jgi:hypothetical protein
MLLGIHGYPNDYFRFTPEGLRAVLKDFAHVVTAGVGDPDIPSSVVAVASHDRPLDLDLAALPSLARVQAEHTAARGKIRIGAFQLTPRELARTVAPELRRLVRERLLSRPR